MIPARESLEKAKEHLLKRCSKNFACKILSRAGIMLCFYNKIALINDDFVKFF